MRTFAIVCLAIATVVADSDPEAYTPLQVALGHTKGGVITGVDYGHGSGLIPAVGVAHAVPLAAVHALPLAAAHAVPVAAVHAAPAVVSSYSALPYTGYAGQHLGYAGQLGYSGLLGYNGYNRHYLGKREAEADAYTLGQVAHGLTNGGVVTGVDYGTGLIPAHTVAVAAAHAVPVAAVHASPAVVSSYSTLPYTGYAGQHLGYAGHLGYSGLLGYNGYNRHYLGKREADAEADAYTLAQVAHGLTNGGVVTGVDYGNGLVSGHGAIGNRPASSVAYTAALPFAAHALPLATHAATHVAPAVVSTYAGLPYTGYTGHLGYAGYTGLAGLGYNGHYIGKREADSEADAYTIGQVAHGLPYANAVAAGNAHNPGYITGTNAPVANFAHAIPATTYTHAIPATTYTTGYPHATGYTGHLGYGYGLRSLGWNY